jgi:hypothetical protein
MSSNRQALDPAKLKEYLDDTNNEMEVKRVKVMEKSFTKVMERMDKEANIFSIVEEQEDVAANNKPIVVPVNDLPSDEEITQLKELCLEIDHLQNNINTLQTELTHIKNMGFLNRLLCIFKGF